MANIFGAESVWLKVDGYDFTTWQPRSLEVESASETQDTTGLSDTARQKKPVGVMSHTVTQTEGLFDTSSNRSHDALSGSVPSSPQSTVRVVCLGLGGDTAGAPFTGFEGAYTHSYKPLSNVGALNAADVEYTITGARDDGVILQPTATKTADWDTNAASVDMVDDTSQRVIPITSNSQASPTVVTTTIPHGLTSGDRVKITGVSGSDIDINFSTSGVLVATVISPTTFSVPVNASISAGTGGQFVRADSSNGGVGYLQVTVTPGVAVGFTNSVVTIEDSADDAAWASLGAFADNVTAPYAERITVAGQVDQFLSIDGNVTGTGSLDYWVGFKRNP